MYKFLDLFFIVFHTSVVLFNSFGWIWKKTRLPNLILLLLTGFSWFILGIFYGIGYCPLTDWHFKVLAQLGVTDLPDSYIKYLIGRLLKLDIDPQLIHYATGIVYFLSLGISVYLNFFRQRKNKTSANFK
jgi:hypothetical protein